MASFLDDVFCSESKDCLETDEVAVEYSLPMDEPEPNDEGSDYVGAHFSNATDTANESVDDEIIRSVICKAVKTVGPDGLIAVEQSRTSELKLKRVPGMKIGRGYVSPEFLIDCFAAVPKHDCVSLIAPYVLVTDQVIDDILDILPLLENVKDSGRPLVIIANDFADDALNALLLSNKICNIRNVAVKAPSYGTYRQDMLRDIAVLVGARPIMNDDGAKLSGVSIHDLGQATAIKVTSDTTLIVAASGNTDSIDARIRQIVSERDVALGDFQRDKLYERIVSLAAGVAIITIGASEDSQRASLVQRLEEALLADHVPFVLL